MKVIFKIKREGIITTMAADIENGKVVCIYETTQPSNIRKLQHDKDVLLIGDKSKRAKGRYRYIQGVVK